MNEHVIVDIVRTHYPAVQGIYLLGSYLTEDERPDSDVDIALLLPHEEAKKERSMAMSACCSELTRLLKNDVDLLNARLVSTVFQREIIAKGRLLYCADRYAVDEFEMLMISYYQKLAEERKGIMDSFLETGRAYAV